MQTYQSINSEFYYSPFNKQQMIWSAAKGMVSSLGDDYSAFETPQQTQQINGIIQGNFSGVGITIGTRNNLPTVIAPIPGTPADHAGILAGDVIMAVDSRDVTKLSVDELANLVRGQAGTQVKLTLSRGGGAPFDVVMTRANIDVPAVTLTMKGDIAEIAVSVFGDKTVPGLDDALQKALQQNAKGVVLDLRNNGGGLVVAAQEMLGRFLPASDIAYWQSLKSDHSDDMAQQVLADAPSTLDLSKTRTIPLVVLVNGGTASASEIVAGALQDYGRAKLVGEQTFGKGSEQHVYPFTDGTSARITFAHWLTAVKKRDINPKPSPTGTVTPTPLPTFTPTPRATANPTAAAATALAQPLAVSQPGRGLTPDIVVVRTLGDYQQDKDPQLDRAIQYLQAGR